MIIHITVFFSLSLPDVQDKDGDSTIINQLKKVNRFVRTRSVEEQSQALKKYLKNSSSKHFRPGDLVMKDIDTDGKQLEEKGFSLKVSFRIKVFNVFMTWLFSLDSVHNSSCSEFLKYLSLKKEKAYYRFQQHILSKSVKWQINM